MSCDIGCLYSSCGCGAKSGEPKFEILGLGLLTTSSIQESVDTSKTYSYAEIFKTIIITNRGLISSKTNSQGSWFVNGAVACSPAPARAIQSFLKIEFISLVDVTLDDANDFISKGKDITGRFVMAHSGSSDLQPIATFLLEPKAIYEGDTYSIRLLRKPFKETRIKFRVDVTMTDGKIFSFVNQIFNVS